MNYAALRSNSNTQTLSPQYSANLSIGVTHSLLRDFGRGIAETRLRVAERVAAIAENNLFTRISQLIQRVEETYWNLAFLAQNVAEKRRSRDAARQFLTQNENLLRAGRVAPVSVLQASAAVAELDRDVIAAQVAADEYEDRLKNLLWLDLNTTDLTLVDSPDIFPVSLSPARSLQDALLRRPELRALRQEQEQRAIELQYAGNQRRPRLDLSVQFSLAGLSGRPNLTCLDPTAPLCVPVGSNLAGSVLEGRTAARNSLSDLFSLHPYETWSVEVKFQLPIGNNTAEAQYSEASLRQMETNTNLLAMRDQVAIEIRNAIREVQASQERVEASREALAYLENQLGGMRTQLVAGLTTSYDVLQAFEEVDRARTTELQALMDFHVALSKFRLAEASGLERYNIELRQPPRYSFSQAGIIQ
jgi:outer membrane protein TolC